MELKYNPRLIKIKKFQMIFNTLKTLCSRKSSLKGFIHQELTVINSFVSEIFINHQIPTAFEEQVNNTIPMASDG